MVTLLSCWVLREAFILTCPFLLIMSYLSWKAWRFDITMVMGFEILLLFLGWIMLMICRWFVTFNGQMGPSSWLFHRWSTSLKMLTLHLFLRQAKNIMTSVMIWIHQIWNILCVHKRCLLFKKRWWAITAVCIIHLFHVWLSWQNWVKFQSNLHSYKVVAQFVSHVYLALLTSILGGPSPKIAILFARNWICLLEPELWQINSSQHNLDSFCKYVANSLINVQMAKQSLWTIFLIMCMLTSCEILHLMKQLLQNMVMNAFLICSGFNLKHIMPTTVPSQIKGSEIIACKTTRLLHFVVLEVIIRMALLRERSKILRSVLEQCYFMQKECFLSIFWLSFVILHWNALKIDWTILFIEQMDELPIRHSLVWIKSRLMFQTSILLVVLAMSWVTVFNLAAQWFQNGNHGHKWVWMLDIHPHMLQMLLWFSILV
jgi:hypothetical protein